jgi:hypothetical protein
VVLLLELGVEVASVWFITSAEKRVEPGRPRLPTENRVVVLRVPAGAGGGGAGGARGIVGGSGSGRIAHANPRPPVAAAIGFPVNPAADPARIV